MEKLKRPERPVYLGHPQIDSAEHWGQDKDYAKALEEYATTLEAQLAAMEAVVEAARELKEILSDRDYEPDSFTTQPLRVALSKLDEARGGER